MYEVHVRPSTCRAASKHIVFSAFLSVVARQRRFRVSSMLPYTMNAAFVAASPLSSSLARTFPFLKNRTLCNPSNQCVNHRPQTCLTRKPRMSLLPSPHRQEEPDGVDDTSVTSVFDIFNLPSFDDVLTFSKRLLSVVAIVLLLATPVEDALAARAGGRVGGSSFRAPAPRSAAPRSYGGGGGGYYGAPVAPGIGYGYGYGAPSIFMNPFVSPIGLGLGFGNIFFLAVLLAGSVAVSNLLQGRGGDSAVESVDPTTAVALVKVGLLSSARSLQVDLDTLARSADTTTPRGLAAVLSDTVTTLLRHPDYWTHASATVKAMPLSKAEGEFNRTTLEERLKLGEETLTNVSGMRREDGRASATETDLGKAPSEYIVVVMAVAAAGEIVRKLPKGVDGVKDVERAMKAFATVSMDSVQAVEIIWAPQSLKDTLTEAEMLADHPELKRL